MAELMMIGTAVSAFTSLASGMSQRQEAEEQAAEIEAQGKREYAAAVAQSVEDTRQMEIQLGDAQAAGAASGAGRDAMLEGRIAREGAYRSLTSIWEGEEALAGRKAQAQQTRKDGRRRLTAGIIGGVSKIGTGLTRPLGSTTVGESLLDKYG